MYCDAREEPSPPDTSHRADGESSERAPHVRRRSWVGEPASVAWLSGRQSSRQSAEIYLLLADIIAFCRTGILPAQRLRAAGDQHFGSQRLPLGNLGAGRCLNVRTELFRLIWR